MDTHPQFLAADGVGGQRAASHPTDDDIQIRGSEEYV